MEEAFSAWPTPGAVPAPCDAVRITTTARLHFGFLDPSGYGPRPFGSFGLSLDRPHTRLTLRRAVQFEVDGAETDRAGRYLQTIAAACGRAPFYALRLDEAIPRHAGLGSGTQLALAVGTAFAVVEGLVLSPSEIAAKLGRGRRSGIGIGTFATGGAVLDGGPGMETLPPILSRTAFPEAWRVLLIFEPTSKGLHGSSETAAFTEAPAFPESETAELCRRIVLGAIPALAEHDFTGFCREIAYLQKVMGAYFAPFQGGGLVSPAVARALDWLSAQGLDGVGQSSWGPTGFGFVPDEELGGRLLAEAQARREFSSLRFTLASACNHGAVIEAG